jgi:hypothetical protein
MVYHDITCRADIRARLDRGTRHSAAYWTYTAVQLIPSISPRQQQILLHIQIHVIELLYYLLHYNIHSRASLLRPCPDHLPE